MQGNVKSCLTAGVAVVGAGAIAMTPIAPPPDTFDDGSRTHEISLLAATTQDTQARQELTNSLALLQSGDPFALLRAFIDGTLAAFEAPGPRPYVPVTGPIDGLSRIGQGVTASGLRFGAATVLTPLRFVGLAAAIAEGNGAQAFTDLITNLVDGPLWVADPALYGLRDALPAPFGGPGGLIENFRNGIWSATEEVSAALLDPAAAVRAFVDGTLAAFEAPGPRPYVPVTGPIDGLSRITEGAIASGLRLVAAAILTPLRFVGLAAAIVEGNGAQALSALITNLADGPLWVADPVLYGLRDALPAPFGGPGEMVENFRNGIWAATERINAAVQSILGLPAAGPTSSGSSVNSIPSPQARLLNLQDDQQNPESQLGDPVVDDTGAVDPVADVTDPADPTADDTGAADPVADVTDPADPAADDTGAADPVADVTDPADAPADLTDLADAPAANPLAEKVKSQKPKLNLVRESPNFSTGVDANDGQDTSGKDADELDEDAPPQVDPPKAEAPKAGADDGGEGGSTASDATNSGSSDGGDDE